MQHRGTAWIFASAVVLAGLVAGGCSDRGRKTRKMKTIQGVVTRIDLPSKEVSMRFRNDKGMDIELNGSIMEDTEVIINGMNRKLGDVVVGDTVTVIGYREREGESVKLVATKVEVNRAGKDAWQETTRGGAGATTTPAPAVPPGKGS